MCVHKNKIYIFILHCASCSIADYCDKGLDINPPADAFDNDPVVVLACLEGWLQVRQLHPQHGQMWLAQRGQGFHWRVGELTFQFEFCELELETIVIVQ